MELSQITRVILSVCLFLSLAQLVKARDYDLENSRPRRAKVKAEENPELPRKHGIVRRLAVEVAKTTAKGATIGAKGVATGASVSADTVADSAEAVAETTADGAVYVARGTARGAVVAAKGTKRVGTAVIDAFK